MSQPESRLWKQVAWVLVALALLACVIAIYRYLTPSPRQLAVPERFSLEGSQHFVLDSLPMGKYYRLRACENREEVKVTNGPWTSTWVTLDANPQDEPKLDLRIDGRHGGELIIEARASTGLLLLFLDKSTAECTRAER